jgi:putative ABC transport system ATP-binding protein
MIPVPSPLYEIADLRRSYSHVHALKGVDLTLTRGEMVAIEGASGSGKSTLLAILGGLDRPSEGVVRFDGADLSELTDAQLTALRGREIGFVFQSFNLIPTLSAVQNVESVMGPLRLPPGEQRARALELLERVGLSARAGHLPSRLSGGEQQRVAIARALANGPRVVLADEPTGNLDSSTARDVIGLLRGLSDDLGVTVVLVTHDREIAAQAPRRIAMRDGLVLSDSHPVECVPRLQLVPAVAETVRVPRALSARLVGQAAGLVALAGVGAATMLPHHITPASAVCHVTCQAVAPAVLPDVRPVPRHVVVPAHNPAPAATKHVVVALAAPPITRVANVTPAPPRATPAPSRVQPPVSKPKPKPVLPVTSPAPVVAVAPPTVTDPTPAPDPVQVWSPFSWLDGSGSLGLWQIWSPRSPQG